MARSALSLKGRALRHLAAREHSRAELEHKLAAHEEESGQLRRVLDELQSKGFISEQRVIESVIHRRAAKLGTARVAQDLRRMGLDEAALGDALVQMRATEVDRAREVWRKKFGAPATDAAERARQMRFLASRGFAPEAIYRVMRDDD